jgi:hypothetical protein
VWVVSRVWPSAMATVTAPGRPAPAPLSCALPSCARAPAYRAFLSRAPDCRKGAHSSCAGGLPTRSVVDLVQAMGMTGISKGTAISCDLSLENSSENG